MEPLLDELAFEVLEQQLAHVLHTQGVVARLQLQLQELPVHVLQLTREAVSLLLSCRPLLRLVRLRSCPLRLRPGLGLGDLLDGALQEGAEAGGRLAPGVGAAELLKALELEQRLVAVEAEDEGREQTDNGEAGGARFDCGERRLREMPKYWGKKTGFGQRQFSKLIN